MSAGDQEMFQQESVDLPSALREAAATISAWFLDDTVSALTLDAALPAYLNAAAAALADRLEQRAGWVMVPREPTEAMHKALSDLGSAMVPDQHERDQWTWFAVKAYRAMLAALPAPPLASQPDEET
jgi:hypothetical protein